LDANALDYIMEQEGESAMDRLSNIFQNEERLRLADKLALAQRALKFVGANEQANSMYHALMLDAQIPAVIKQSLAEGMTGANQMILADAPVTADEIKTRMQILETVRATVEDAATHEAVTKASDQLQQMLNQLPVLQP
jgi:ABC-type cobalamin/Fe3+-siderophores transport system ATPase subunit